jgi:hypothetical protein
MSPSMSVPFLIPGFSTQNYGARVMPFPAIVAEAGGSSATLAMLTVGAAVFAHGSMGCRDLQSADEIAYVDFLSRASCQKPKHMSAMQNSRHRGRLLLSLTVGKASVGERFRVGHPLLVAIADAAEADQSLVSSASVVEQHSHVCRILRDEGQTSVPYSLIGACSIRIWEQHKPIPAWASVRASSDVAKSDPPQH